MTNETETQRLERETNRLSALTGIPARLLTNIRIEDRGRDVVVADVPNEVVTVAREAFGPALSVGYAPLQEPAGHTEVATATKDPLPEQTRIELGTGYAVAVELASDQQDLWLLVDTPDHGTQHLYLTSDNATELARTLARYAGTTTQN